MARVIPPPSLQPNGNASAALNDEALREYRLRSGLGSIYIQTVIVVTVYTFLLKFINSSFVQNANLPFDPDFWFARFMELLMVSMAARFIRKGGMSREECGITLNNWKTALFDATWISAIVIGALFALKWTSITYGFDFVGDGQLLSLGYIDWSFYCYPLFAFFQEFIARGVVQGTVQKLLTGRYANFYAMLITSSVFGVTHAHSPASITMLAFLSGFLWGPMYAKHKNLLGVTLSHFLIGNFAQLMGFFA
ncbi:CPBP family intramembrane glutamic endopeptidase [Paenibacillus qinlingensis]|uniref:CPBP family intramembrane glutamic endopeptidase n=1 Tax=Paenibacillus qinlingensis TaxID=1837343 RepID=UPI00156774D3|nr:CPBP family intramembrane glutamic endopeptidase [Paenibacillus qinlingensis]NQX57959.1 CPBP family intramembrane metalloprotease [Paenibacillus qinlingensis]